MVKFRGKTKKGKWIEGYYFTLVGEKERIDHYIINNPEYTYDPVYELDCVTGFIEVIPSTIAQFTGIEDKNQVEIYGSIEIDGKMSEGGDIVQSVSLKKWVCEREGIGFDPFVANMEHSGDGWHYEVIGNQTDDKNLLE